MATKKAKKPQPKKKKTAPAKKAIGKTKPVAKPKAAKAVAKTKTVAKAAVASKKKARRSSAVMVNVGNQDVETVQMKAKTRVARAGAGGGDFAGASVVEGADSESVDELLEEGQTFEAGIVRGVEEADDDIEQEVRTHEVLQDDVPAEYDEEDRR